MKSSTLLKGIFLTLFYNPESKISWQTLDIFQTKIDFSLLKLIFIGNVMDGQWSQFEAKSKCIRDIVRARVIEHNIKEDVWIMGLEICQLKS